MSKEKQEVVTLKWKMISYKHFEANHDGYLITVHYAFGKMWGWGIFKEDKAIDRAIFHSPTHNELAAKVQAERCFNKVLNEINK